MANGQIIIAAHQQHAPPQLCGIAGIQDPVLQLAASGMLPQQAGLEAAPKNVLLPTHPIALTKLPAQAQAANGA